QRLRHLCCDLTERESRSQEFCTRDMCRKVSVPESKPVGHSVVSDFFETLEGFVAKSPTALSVQFTCHTIHDRIDIGADVKAPHIGIITDVYDDVYFLFGNNSDQSPQKFGSSGSTCQHSIVGANHPIILRGAQSRWPEVENSQWHEMVNIFD